MHWPLRTHLRPQPFVPLSVSFRLLGLLPLLFFLAQAFYYLRRGEAGHILWLCNIGNLLLAIGLLFDQPVLIRVAAVWLIPGLGLWFWFAVYQWGFMFTSTLAHVGGLAVGLAALARVRVDRRTWLHAFIWYLFMQQLCHFITPAALNVNISHKVYEGWEGRFDYGQFWLLTTFLVACALWLIVKLCAKLWPPRKSFAAAPV